MIASPNVDTPAPGLTHSIIRDPSYTAYVASRSHSANPNHQTMPGVMVRSSSFEEKHIPQTRLVNSQTLRSTNPRSVRRTQMAGYGQHSFKWGCCQGPPVNNDTTCPGEDLVLDLGCPGSESTTRSGEYNSGSRNPVPDTASSLLCLPAHSPESMST